MVYMKITRHLHKTDTHVKARQKYRDAAYFSIIRFTCKYIKDGAFCVHNLFIFSNWSYGSQNAQGLELKMQFDRDWARDRWAKPHALVYQRENIYMRINFE